MKKLMLGLAVAGLSAAVFGDVTSANVVGYMGDGLYDGKLNMQGICFTTVAGEGINLNDIQFENLTGGNDAPDSDSVQIWDPIHTGYIIYYYDKYDSCWYGSNTEDDPILEVGTPFWFNAYKNGAIKDKRITVSGAIEGDIVDPFVIYDGKLNMFVNPYPTAINLNDTDTVIFTGLTGGNDAPDSDSIQIWDPIHTGYIIYYYDKYDSCWYGSNTEDEPDIAAGKPFWFNAYKPGAAKEKSIQFVKTF